MAEIIKFPEGAEFFRSVANQFLDITDPQIRERVTKRISETMERLPIEPTFKFFFPESLSICDRDVISDSIKQQYQEQILEFVKGLIYEILILQGELCVCGA